jgi:hypothetical protein
VFVGSRLQDKVYAIVDKGGKREVKIIASGLYRPNGVAFKNGTHRGQSRQPAEADRHPRRSAEG